jgi:hypothetical protein
MQIRTRCTWVSNAGAVDTNSRQPLQDLAIYKLFGGGEEVMALDVQKAVEGRGW